jgi:hypothetical protein
MEGTNSQEPYNDRRRCARYSIEATGYFEWEGTDGERRVAVGRTRNIGIGGLFIASRVAPPLSSPIQAFMYLRVNYESGSRVVMRARGRVCRLEAEPNEGFALRADYELEFRPWRNELTDFNTQDWIN